VHHLLSEERGNSPQRGESQDLQGYWDLQDEKIVRGMLIFQRDGGRELVKKVMRAGNPV
jgi:hypothetical protein